MRRPGGAGFILGLFVALAWLSPRRAAAQSEGAIEGRVREAESGRSLAGVQILVDGRAGSITDTAGQYRVRAVRTGWRSVAARLIGYRGVVLDSVFVRAGATSRADFTLAPSAVELAPLVVTAPVDELLDPLATRAEDQRSGPSRSAGELARGSARAERWKCRSELPWGPAR